MKLMKTFIHLDNTLKVVIITLLLAIYFILFKDNSTLMDGQYLVKNVKGWKYIFHYPILWMLILLTFTRFGFFANRYNKYSLIFGILIALEIMLRIFDYIRAGYVPTKCYCVGLIDAIICYVFIYIDSILYQINEVDVSKYDEQHKKSK